MRRRSSNGSKDPTFGAWWLTLGAGLVVALVVWALLEILRRAVLEVESAVADVWTSGKRLAQNTQAVHTLNATVARGGAVADEAEKVRELVREGGS